MDELDAKEKVGDIITKARKLDWVQPINGEPYMHLADVEKCMMAILNESFMFRINEWIEGKK